MHFLIEKQKASVQNLSSIRPESSFHDHVKKKKKEKKNNFTTKEREIHLRFVYLVIITASKNYRKNFN